MTLIGELLGATSPLCSIN